MALLPLLDELADAGRHIADAVGGILRGRALFAQDGRLCASSASLPRNPDSMMARAHPRRHRALAAAALALAAGALAFDALAAGVGDPAPTFALPTAAGDIIALPRLAGKVVYVDFWASWCAPCRRSFPWMNELHQRYAARGLTIVAVNVDRKRADAEQFLARYPAEFAVVFDPAGVSPGAYAVPGMPTSYLIDARGNIVHVEQGFLDDRQAALEARIRSLLATR